MADSAPELYQGSDWLTYRWPVAQMFDTLDRIRDLCHSAARPGVTPKLMSAPNPLFDKVFDQTEEEAPDLFLCIAELCDDLMADLDAVLADLFSFLQNNAAHGWMGFEMRLHLREMRENALIRHMALSQDTKSDANNVDEITALAARIRDLLRAIDQ